MARSKEFIIDVAVKQALDIFWANGYKNTSLSLITRATQLHKGSLYGAFKSKENLFSLCVERYVGDTLTTFCEEDTTAKEFLKTFFLKKLNCTKDRKAKGCLLMNSAIEFANIKDDFLKLKFDQLLQGIQKKFEKIIISGKKNNEFSKNLCAKITAERLLALAFTVEEMGKLGKGREFLRNIINGTLNELEIKV